MERRWCCVYSRHYPRKIGWVFAEPCILDSVYPKQASFCGMGAEERVGQPDAWGQDKWKWTGWGTTTPGESPEFWTTKLYSSYWEAMQEHLHKEPDVLRVACTFLAQLTLGIRSGIFCPSFHIIETKKNPSSNMNGRLETGYGLQNRCLSQSDKDKIWAAVLLWQRISFVPFPGQRFRVAKTTMELPRGVRQPRTLQMWRVRAGKLVMALLGTGDGTTVVLWTIPLKGTVLSTIQKTRMHAFEDPVQRKRMRYTDPS